MSQSIDFRINDFINEYLDYKGYQQTVDTFITERSNRQESIQTLKNPIQCQEKDSIVQVNV